MPTKHVEPEARHAAIAGRPVRLGKQKPKKDARTLKLAKYLQRADGKKATVATLPPLPSKVQRSHLVPTGAWGMLGNDEYGDCTIAAAGHAKQITTASVSNGANIAGIATSEILAAYWDTGVPPTPGADDNGRNELDVLNYWRSTGIAGSKVEVYAAIDLHADRLHKLMKFSIDLFGFVYVGLALPESAQKQAEWKVGRGASGEPGSWGGHAVIGVDYDGSSISFVTWGEVIKATWGFVHRYCDEAYAVMLPDWFNAQGQSPVGLNVDALMSDLHSITK